jgi:dihydrodipicolinate synthase/N-acetylneuraminate lyase
MGKIRTDLMDGVWSAAPTPFTDGMEIDAGSVGRMVEHHVRLGVKGLFLAGSNGEGPWLTDARRQRLVQEVVKRNKGRMAVAVQVTENSAQQILENIDMVKKAGADIAVMAPPFFLFNDTPENVKAIYLTVIRESSLPMGIYDRGAGGGGKVCVPDSILKDLYAEKNVVLVKDSSSSPARRTIALAARRRNPSLRLLSGDEFTCVDYLQAGYDGLLLGGGVFNGYMAGLIMDAVRAGDITLAQGLQKRMNRIMFDVYGGKKISCWLSGEKKLLVEMGLFRNWKNTLNYPLTESCKKAIARVMKNDRDMLFPWKD